MNAVPLSEGLDRHPEIELTYDVPSALADRLARGELDAALVPAVEAVRDPSYRIVPRVAITCTGAVLSVKLFCRVPPGDIRTVALDPSSRTSSMLARLWLEGLAGLSPEYVPPGNESTDATLLIGDPALRHQTSEHDVDLGEVWYAATGLPFVFAVWAMRADVGDAQLAEALLGAKLNGVQHLDRIADAEYGNRRLSPDLCRAYLTEHIRYDLAEAETAGLRWFLTLASEHGLLRVAPSRLDDMVMPVSAR